MKIDKVYIVTIDHTDENYSDTLNRIMDIDLPNRCDYEFLGVNGYGISNSDLEELGYSIYDNWNISKSNDSLIEKSNKYWLRDMTRGEVGCVLSHIQIWEDAYNNNYDNILIYEDDVISDSKFDWSVLQQLRDVNYDLFYIGRFPQFGFNGVYDTPLDKYPNLCKPGYSYQTHAYMLSKTGIAKIVEDYIPILKSNLVPADEFLPSICGWTPRLDLNDLFPNKIRAYGLTDWENSVYQIRTENFGNSLTQPTND